ncbi:MAG: helix-turn-helix domain-containing protein [Eubacteriales bacterium]|nr:helix-turn-helix domain-containing protein [Eubacteriales bacterium]MDY3332493.1 helix-turn-helix domain-containing protein [Gallibacter sp.]
MTVKEILKKSQLNQSEFSKLFGIPLRTVQDWHAGKRNPPEYVINLLDIVISNGYIKTKI